MHSASHGYKLLISRLHLGFGNEENGRWMVVGNVVFPLAHASTLFSEWVSDMAFDVAEILAVGMG